MSELKWFATTKWESYTMELRLAQKSRDDKTVGASLPIGWLTWECDGVFEYVHSDEAIPSVINIPVHTVEEAQKVAETAVRLSCDLRKYESQLVQPVWSSP